MKPNNNIPQRKSPRAHWLDYNDGRYFVTVCTHGHEHYLGFIENDVMTLSDVGMFLDNQLRNATMHQSYVSVLQHVVMPNHFHAIIEVDSEIVGTRHGVSVKTSTKQKRIRTLHATSLHGKVITALCSQPLSAH